MDAKAVYWANKNGNKIMKVGLDGGEPVTLAFGLQPWGVAVTSTNVYWTNYFANSVGTVGLNAKNPNSEVALGGTYPTAIAARGNHVYWSAGGLWMLDVVTGDLTTDRELGASDFTSDETHIYWTSGGNGESDGAIMSMMLDGSNVTPVVLGLSGPLGITLAHDSLYWTNQDGTVQKAGSSSSVVSTLASGQGNPGYIAADDRNVYWTNRDDGLVLKTTVDGDSPVVIASNQAAPTHIATDLCNLYWVNRGDGTVMKLQK